MNLTAVRRARRVRRAAHRRGQTRRAAQRAQIHPVHRAQAHQAVQRGQERPVHRREHPGRAALHLIRLTRQEPASVMMCILFLPESALQ